MWSEVAPHIRSILGTAQMRGKENRPSDRFRDILRLSTQVESYNKPPVLVAALIDQHCLSRPHRDVIPDRKRRLGPAQG